MCIDAEKQLHHFVADTDVEAKVASLAVSCAMGEFQFTGGGMQSGGSISGGRAFLATRSLCGIFACYWDIVVNRGNFSGTLALLWRDGASPFAEFLCFSDWLHATLRRTHQIALQSVAQGLFDFLTENGADRATVAAVLEADWKRTPGREALSLRGVPAAPAPLKPAAIRAAHRQARHTQLN